VEVINLLMKMCKFNFGEFEEQEFRKFLRMGMIFMLIIGFYWSLRPLKDSIFIQLVGKLWLPYAKTVSVLFMLPFVAFYTTLVGKYSKEKVLTVLPSVYAGLVFIFAAFIFLAQSKIFTERITTCVMGYAWYFFVESFGSVVIALFWAFAADTTDPKTAKRGFPFVYAMGQFGGVLFPYAICSIPYFFNFKTDLSSMLVLGVLSLLIPVLVKYFIKATPKELLTSFEKGATNAEEPKKKKGEAKFTEGLKILISHKYLICIFAANFIFEFIVTVFDFNFKVAASDAFSGIELSRYLGKYAASVNIVSFVCLLGGVSNVTRFLGVGVALAAMPVILGVALLGFLTMNSLNFLFVLMVGSKAINYALNGPALKQLYIPTTADVHFKAQAWIETFGSRASKEAGSLFNMLLKPMQDIFGLVLGRSRYLMLSGAIGFPLVVMWFVVAMYLGKTFKTAVNENKVVC
jgi:AAA family ATP:ADP antiporter